MGQLTVPENPSEATETSEGVVMFLLGARLNQCATTNLPPSRVEMLTVDSPLGKLGPGAVQVNDVFNDMWREAERNSSKWGCKP